MDKGVTFIKDNFARIELLKESASGSTEIVQGMDKQIFVRKTIPYTGLPYQTLAKLQHALLPLIYYVAEDDKNTYVIEEYITGQNLQELLEKKGCFSEKQVTNIAVQLCEVLQLLHEHQILHRDIKPDNIILKGDGSIKLIDFGAARLADYGQHGHDTHILGTEGYAPPEQYGFAPTDVRSDLYAVGVTIKTLLGPNYHGKLLKIAGCCTQLDPEQRIASAKALESALLANKSANYKKICVALVVLLLVAGGYYQWQSSHVKPIAGGTSAVTDVNKGATQAGKNYFSLDGKKEGSKPNNSVAAPVQGKKDAAPASQQLQGKAVAAVSTDNWNFAEVNVNDDRPQLALLAKQAKQSGSTLVTFASNTGSPGFTVRNNSDVPLKNPRINLIFNNFGVKGTYSAINVDGSTKEITDFNSKDVTQKVTVQLVGEVAAHASHYFSLAGLESCYVLGASPSVRVLVSADNAAAQETSTRINIK
jgi:serine/threonine protein kinase